MLADQGPSSGCVLVMIIAPGIRPAQTARITTKASAHGDRRPCHRSDGGVGRLLIRHLCGSCFIPFSVAADSDRSLLLALYSAARKGKAR